ncbi:MAG: CinA family nicotinamide mononucleotide deamidase-related protein [Acidobacteria bacterium]|nr:CinA family nicotinamide mononucleotide deamidase-related protein [Acidobacteriota bacterium]
MTGRRRPSPRVEILSVGEELLGGDRREGNAEYLAGRFGEGGFRVRYKTTVGDDPAEIVPVLRRALERVEVVVATGGLGPTMDDRTVEAVAEAFHAPWSVPGPLLRRLLRRAAGRHGGLPAVRRQARVPRGFRAVPNPVGTAPGLIRFRDGKAVVLLPGVPGEARGLFEASMLPWLRRRFRTRSRPPWRVLRIAGLPEPRVDRAAAAVFRREGTGIPTVLSDADGVAVRLGPAGSPVTRRIERSLRRTLGAAVVGGDGETLEGSVGGRLRLRRATVATAESCTGGMLGERISSLPGASRYFRGGIVAYQRGTKESSLGIPRSLVRRRGPVSSAVAARMAREVRRRFGADFGLSITGIAGPGGGTPEHPVGEVFIGLAGGAGVRVRRFRFRGDRQRVRRRACAAALDLLRRRLIREGGRQG